MKGDFDFEAEDDGLSFGLDNEEEEMDERLIHEFRDSIVVGILHRLLLTLRQLKGYR